MALSQAERICFDCRLPDCGDVRHLGCRLRQAQEHEAWRALGLVPPPSYRRRRRRPGPNQLCWQVLVRHGGPPQLCSEARMSGRRLLVWFTGYGRPDPTHDLSLQAGRARLL